MNYTLTPMTAEHIPQIAALERACFSHPWTEDMLREELWNDAADRRALDFYRACGWTQAEELGCTALLG